MNKIILIGRLATEPEVRYTQSDKAVCNFTLDVEGSLDDVKAIVTIEVEKKQVKDLAKCLMSCDQCTVDGRLLSKYCEDNDGTRKYRLEVITRAIEFYFRLPF